MQRTEPIELEVKKTNTNYKHKHKLQTQLQKQRSTHYAKIQLQAAPLSAALSGALLAL